MMCGKKFTIPFSPDNNDDDNNKDACNACDDDSNDDDDNDDDIVGQKVGPVLFEQGQTMDVDSNPVDREIQNSLALVQKYRWCQLDLKPLHSNNWTFDEFADLENFNQKHVFWVP